MPSLKVLSLLILALPTVGAQAREEVYQLDPLTVNIQESVDLSFAGLERADLRTRQTRGVNFQEILPSIPGVYAGNPTTGTFSIRGLNQDSLFSGFGAVTSPLITVYDDGVPLTTTTLRYLPTPVYGLESMTLTKGSANHDPGPASLAGSLRFQSVLPRFELVGQSRLEYSEASTLSGFIAQDAPLLENELAMRASYHSFESDGHASSMAFDDFSAYDRDRAKVDLLWHPSANKNQSLVLTLLHDESGGNPQANTAIIPGAISLSDRTSLVNTPSSYPAQRQAASLRGSFLLPNDLTLETVTAFQDIELEQNLDFDGTALLNWTINGVIDERVFSQSVALFGERDAWMWELGGYLEDSQFDNDYSGVGFAPLPLGSPYKNSATTELQTLALYGELGRALAHGLSLNVGLRYQHDARDFDGSSNFSIFPTRLTSSNTQDDVLLPSLELAWTPSPETSLALFIARGHRAGGVAFAPIAGVSGNYEAESSWDLELTGRQDICEQITLSAAIFHSWIEDQQVSNNLPGGVAGLDLLVANAGKSTRYGAELEARWKPMDGLSFYANTAWLQTDFAELTLNGVDRSGENFPNAPEWSFAVGADYRHASGFFANANYNWTDTTFSVVNDPDTSALETRSLLNTRVGYTWKQATFYIFGTNLFDDEYALYRGLPSPPIPQVGKSGAPRMVGVGVELEW